MKKLIVLTTASLMMMMNAHAKNLSCGYKDYFRLSDNAHPGIYVVSGFSDGDVLLNLVGPRSFVITDSYQCSSGYAHVTVAYDAANWCVLDIKDGPYMNHPTVKAACNGIRYINTQYDGFNSYSYTINLD
jgi:hypothetical protein